MDRTAAVFTTDREAEPFSGVDREPDLDADVTPFLHVMVAMQKRDAERRLDSRLADLVTSRAAEFAALSPREQAAIAWVDAVISSGKPQVADGAYAALRRHFDDAAVAKLTALAGTASARARLGGLRRG